MEIFLVENNADQILREKIAQLMMGQMEAIGDSNSYSTLITAIDLALGEGSPAKMFAVEENDQIIGLAFFNIGISLDKGGNYIWLNDLYVHKDFRQKGIAKKLLLHTMFWAEQNNLKGIELETGVNNVATKRLYNSFGFHDIVSNRYGLDIN
ncbi:GNAT family N-acetyltransferase [Anaerobacillus isosaccharinicus]|uniref:GNAT family N-acetyltransferase n=1 Tax=Anaerobacillus isosaccharinicus TaxID=1532552 RepID=A0A7S7LCY0_9BACI|nr:GNAT family N-acetyltransferase [Anaerobacillus isosaccharinicus]